MTSKDWSDGKLLLFALAKLGEFLLGIAQKQPAMPGGGLPPLARVNVSLRTRGELRGSMSGEGIHLREQLLKAVHRARLDTRFSGPVIPADLPALTIEVGLQTAAADIPPENRGSPQLQLGIDGVGGA